MNIECTYNGSNVNIVNISPSVISGYLDIVYVDSSNVTVHEMIEYVSTIATSVTEIGEGV